MKISKIVIHNYRSILHEEITPSDFNIFVGQNNHGKTNFFEAIEWFYNGARRGEDLLDLSHGRTPDKETYVEIEFIGALEGASLMRNEINKTKITKLLDGNDTITVKRSSNSVKTRTLSINGSELEKTPTGFDNALNDFLPKFEYVDTKQYYVELIKFGKNTPIRSMLSGVLEALLETNKEFRAKFDELFCDDGSEIKAQLDSLSGKVKVYLEKQFPECVRVEFIVTQPSFEELLKNFNTTIDDGIVTDAEEKGDGMQRALMLAIIQTYADYRRENEDMGKSFLFFIDEAELHLHPSAQRNLKNALYELSQRGDQVFINTHSSVFVVDDQEKQSIYKIEKHNKQTTAEPVSELEKPKVVFELLGGSPSDLLLPRNFMIVEGRCEELFLDGVIKRFYIDKPTIQIIYANGDLNKQEQSMTSINAAYVPLGEKSPIYREKLIILCDKIVSDKKINDKKKFLEAYKHLEKNEQFYELAEDAIEKCYPPTWKKTHEEVKEMGKIQNEKVNYARKVAKEISQQEFEQEMPEVYQALCKCWDLAFK
ncbi:MAG TPA: AAA family ATPase [Candidatus Woesebacteria bacterium]|nr:AAA family ATPase [Candidatus Woesebacteria bacterium]